MRNPLNKRVVRELKGDFGKYIVIFLFLVMLICLVTGFIVADDSFKKSYDEGFEKYNIEDGNITFNIEPKEELLDKLQEAGNLILYDLRYVEEDETNGSTIRVYQVRQWLNKECLWDGKLPENDNEIALDRMYAKNNNFEVGSKVNLNGKELTVSGLIAVPDYSCLFKSNSDMMFDSINFGVAVMTKDGYENIGSTHEFHNYAWKYNEPYESKKEAKDKSDDFIDEMKEIIKAYDTEIIQVQVDDLYDKAQAIEDELQEEIDDSEIVTVKGYTPRYLNQAINFTGDDMGKDKAMFIVFDYLVTIVLGFVFAVTISNTISSEAGVIGTLRASGYTRGELIRHYMILPIAVSLVATVVGNLLGYLVFVKMFVNVYLNSYSFAKADILFSPSALILTSVVPLVMMALINFIVLSNKMKLKPLKFLRRDLKKNSKKKAIRLSRKIPFILRFFMRILLQNIPAYLVLILGIILGGMVIIFGTMFIPLLDDYSELIKESKIAEYQYVLKEQVETSNEQAEKYCLESLDTVEEGYITDTVSIYGVTENSKYVRANMEGTSVAVSNGMAEKYNLKAGSEIELEDPYTERKYSFKVSNIYNYDAAMAVFMSRETFLEAFNEEEDYFTGYFSNEELTDIDGDDIASVITVKDMTKLADQLKQSMGEFTKMFQFFGVIMFLLLIFILSKQIIEKNKQSISMTKILGFSNIEISALYLLCSFAAVLAGVIIAIPTVDTLLRLVFKFAMYRIMSGYIPYIVSGSCYVKMAIYAILSFVFVAAFMMIKINKIQKSEALKNVEY